MVTLTLFGYEHWQRQRYFYRMYYFWRETQKNPRPGRFKKHFETKYKVIVNCSRRHTDPLNWHSILFTDEESRTMFLLQHATMDSKDG